MTKTTFPINDRWRLSDDGKMQWVLEYRAGQSWQAKAFCVSNTGLLEIALPHNRITAPEYVLAALATLPDLYELGALKRISVGERHSIARRDRVLSDALNAPEQPI